MSQPVANDVDPALWYRADYDQSRNWIVELRHRQVLELEHAVEATSDLPIVELNRERFELPGLGKTLHHIRTTLIHGRGFSLIRGLPVLDWDRERSARAFYGLGCHLGIPVPQNASGHLLGHVRDLGLDHNDPVNRVYQTRYRQLFHTDSTDIVGLLCLHAARTGGENSICSSTTIYHEITKRRPDLLQVLCQPFHVDRKGEVPEGKSETYEMAVFYPQGGHVTCMYARDFIEAAQRHTHVPRLRREQIEAMDLVDELAASDAIRLDMDFEPGDMQFLHNHQVLHARTSYHDWPEPERKRHLLRLWLATPDGRTLPRDFEERYGKIEPGKPRGGIRVPGSILQAPLEP